MARKRRKKKKTSSWLSFGVKRTKKQKASTVSFKVEPGYHVFLIILVTSCILAGVFYGFQTLEQYVWRVSPVAEKYGPIELIDKPSWFNSELVWKVENTAGGKSFVLEENTAKFIAEKLQSLPWLNQVKAQTTNNSIRVSVAKYRKPIAMVKASSNTYYISEDMVVLDYVPLNKLVIVEIKGASSPPGIGKEWATDSIVSAIELLRILNKMDNISTPDKPLLNEIDCIDVSNIGGRKDSRKPHILLYANDGTQIFWGAAIGESTRYLEATEKEKLAMLYGFYKEHNTVQGLVKYIELRHPQKDIPRPTE